MCHSEKKKNIHAKIAEKKLIKKRLFVLHVE